METNALASRFDRFKPRDGSWVGCLAPQVVAVKRKILPGCT